MSLKNKFFTFTAAAAATFAFSAIGMAQEPTTTTTPAEKKVEKFHKGEGRGMGGKQHGMRQGKQGMHRGGMKHMMHDLNLTEEQKTQIRSIRQANKPSPELREEVRTLATAKRDGTITAAQQERLTALRTQAKERGRLVHEQIQGVLTAEQKAQIEQKKLEMKTRMEERRLRRQQNAPAATSPKVVTKDN